jgi:hypothetical protein
MLELVHLVENCFLYKFVLSENFLLFIMNGKIQIKYVVRVLSMSWSEKLTCFY